MGGETVKKQLLLALIGVGMLLASAVPVHADGLGGGQPTRTEHVQIETDAGHVTAAWNSQWGNELIVAYWEGPYWFRCSSYGQDVLMPSMKQQGPSTMTVSGRFAPEDFDRCWGTPEAWDISFEFEVIADYAVVSNANGQHNMQIIHGDQTGEMSSKFRSHALTGYDVTANGTLFGSTISNTAYGQFGSGSFQSEGP